MLSDYVWTYEGHCVVTEDGSYYTFSLDEIDTWYWNCVYTPAEKFYGAVNSTHNRNFANQ